MSLGELEELAKSLGLKPGKLANPTTLIYDIIDEESLQGARGIAAEPKKRGRKPKAENVGKADEGNTIAGKAEPKKRGRKPKTAEATTDAAQTSEAQTAAPASTIAPEPKKRGRKPKATVAQEATAATGSSTADSKTEAVSMATDNSLTSADITAQRSANVDDNKNASDITTANTDSIDEDIDFIVIKDIPDLSLTGGYHSPTVKPTTDTTMQSRPLAPQTARTATTPRQTNKMGDTTEYDFEPPIIGCGVLEVMPEGHGYLRSSDYNYMPAPDDIYISAQQIRQWGLKVGDVVEGAIRLPRDNEKFFTMSRIEHINGRKPHEVRDRVAFEHLTPLFPDEKFTLCANDNAPLSVRVVDLFAPIGKGQRALLVAQPKTGKTILMKEVANAIAAHHPEAYLMVLLIDERPEEVTDMARTVNAEVIASTFDEPAENHVHVANLVIEKAKRLVESGRDVVIFLDSITRLARAYNTVAPASGKILSGGVDANSLQKPKRFFGAARNIEGGGSLTIIATALIDTGSKMDEVIFEEFKGTGNMELQLDRMLANKRIFPAVNIIASSTRRDDLLQEKMTLDRMWILRKMIADMTPTEAMTFVKERLEGTRNNEEFLMSMGKLN